MAQYIIKITRYFYGPTEKVTYYSGDYSQSGHRQQATLMSHAEATELVSELDGRELYQLAHNESGRPTYRVVRA